ncbi:hypothetical protein ECC30_06410 [Helicobacter pylori]|nr:hypothetical protein ECC28_06405 [Helicobacter pylori]RVY55502.1 hypothetical protein ECC30_06410 [Helicobacter pylori]RVY95629.1 hypothetical protein EC517_06765 [Helicobacter pylori]
MVRRFFLFVADIFDRILKILKTLFVFLLQVVKKKLCPHQILTNKTLFNLKFFGFLKQAKRKERRKKPPLFLGVFFLLIPLKRKE